MTRPLEAVTVVEISRKFGIVYAEGRSAAACHYCGDPTRGVLRAARDSEFRRACCSACASLIFVVVGGKS